MNLFHDYFKNSRKVLCCARKHCLTNFAANTQINKQAKCCN